MQAIVIGRSGGRSAKPLATAILLFGALAWAAFALLTPALAHAEYEQMTEHFGGIGEAAQIGEATAMAVKLNGMGGAQTGSFYVVGGKNRVVRFAPGKEGEEPQFEEAWGWGIAEGGPEGAYVRCGPAYVSSANPAEHTYVHCKSTGIGGGSGGEEVGHFTSLEGVAIDQGTGDVYVRNFNGVGGGGTRQHHLIEVFTATGTPVGEGFGDSGDGLASPPEAISAGPERLHRSNPSETSGIAVDNSGTVYVTDADFVGVEHPQARVMSFRPCIAGNYEQYCYGAGKDTFIQMQEAFRLSLVGANRLVVASKEAVNEYPTGQTNPATLCNLSVSGQQLLAMTTNVVTGELFYYTFADRSVHRREACNESTGEFKEIQKMKPQPTTKNAHALAVNPALSWGAQRPGGVLYAVDVENLIGDVFSSAKLASPPGVDEESVSNTTESSSIIGALINPNGFALSYRAEYLSAAAYASNGNSFEGPNRPEVAPVSEGHLPNGPAALIAVAVAGLTPDTTYRFRVVVTSSCNGPEQAACITIGPPASFATYATASAGLPDHRSYELVSPADKHGGEVFPAEPRSGSCEAECKPPGGGITTVYPMQSSPDGESVSYMGYPFFLSEGSAVFNSYVSRRTASGWQTAPMSPPALATRGGEHLAYSSQLGADVVRQGNPQLSVQAPANYENLYVQSAAEPDVFTPLVTTTPPHRSPGTFAIEYGGHSPDFSAQFFAASDALTRATPFAPEPPDPGASGRDLYEWRNGSLALVNVLPGNAGVASGPAFASSSPDAHSVAANGRRVFWHVGNAVFVREDGQATRELQHAGNFLVASESGLIVLFRDGCLYSLETETCTDLTQGKGGFLGIAGNSSDLSRIYFVDTAQLPAPNSGSNQGQAGHPNLYVYEAGVGSTLVATLLPSDGSGEPGALADWVAAFGERTAEASPSGRYLAFASTAQLTGYGNVGPCKTVGNAEEGFHLVDAPCAEAFLYDSATGILICPSCNPTGEAPRGVSTLRRINGIENRPWIPQPRYLTDQGRFVFDSQDRLSSRDTNGRVEDVYEAEPFGVGSCDRVIGCVSLLSRGAGMVDSNFLAMDESGANVFYTSRERLVPGDVDELIDLYDAREGGGFPAEAEIQPAECRGEACQPSPGPREAASPASQRFEGAGNLKPAKSEKCSRGKVKQGGKCVNKKHARKGRKRTASHNRRNVK